MLSPLLRAKQARYFSLVDVDGDGVVTASDWAEIGRNLAALRGFKPHSAAYDAILSVMGSIWSNLSTYASDPARERVTLADWLRFEAERVVYGDDAFYESYVNTIARNVHGLLDAEGRGWIGAGAYVDIMMSFWVSPEDAFDAFRRLDTDGDGRLTVDAFVDHIRDFHRSEDPDAPGNWLFGPFDAPRPAAQAPGSAAATASASAATEG